MSTAQTHRSDFFGGTNQTDVNPFNSGTYNWGFLDPEKKLTKNQKESN